MAVTDKWTKHTLKVWLYDKEAKPIVKEKMVVNAFERSMAMKKLHEQFNVDILGASWHLDTTIELAILEWENAGKPRDYFVCITGGQQNPKFTVTPKPIPSTTGYLLDDDGVGEIEIVEDDSVIDETDDEQFEALTDGEYDIKDHEFATSMVTVQCENRHAWIIPLDRMKSHGGVPYSMAEVTCLQCGKVALEYQGLANKLRADAIRRELKKLMGEDNGAAAMSIERPPETQLH
jgi:hypothetical protein